MGKSGIYVYIVYEKHFHLPFRACEKFTRFPNCKIHSDRLFEINYDHKLNKQYTLT